MISLILKNIPIVVKTYVHLFIISLFCIFVFVLLYVYIVYFREGSYICDIMFRVYSIQLGMTRPTAVTKCQLL